MAYRHPRSGAGGAWGRRYSTLLRPRYVGHAANRQRRGLKSGGDMAGYGIGGEADHVSSGSCLPLRTGGGMGRIPHPPHRWRRMCLGAPWSLGTCRHRILSRSCSVCAAARSSGLGASCRRIACVPSACQLHSDYGKRRFHLLGHARPRGCHVGNRHIPGKFLRSYCGGVGWMGSKCL